MSLVTTEKYPGQPAPQRPESGCSAATQVLLGDLPEPGMHPAVRDVAPEQRLRELADHRVVGVDDVAGGGESGLADQLVRVELLEVQELGGPGDEVQLAHPVRVLERPRVAGGHQELVALDARGP